MSVFQPGNVAYGLSQALIGVPNEPIVAQRAPTTNDKATIGTLWIDQPANTPYILTSIVDNVATWVFSSGSGSILSIVTDAGTAFPVAGVVNLLGGANIVTSAAGNTIDVAVTPNINLPTTNAAGTQGIYEIGGLRFAYAYPPSNTFVGIIAGNTTLNSGAATGNTGIGSQALESLTLGDSNTGVGEFALQRVTTGTKNTSTGQGSASEITTGELNTAVGWSSLGMLTTGTRNIAVGHIAGVSYTGAEDSNIVIGNQGVLGESNVIRIGQQGSGSSQQDACAIAGIYNTGIGATNQVMFIDNTGFLGSSKGTNGQLIIGSTAGSPAWANLTAGTNITITNAANSITIDAAGGGGITTLEADDTNTASGATVTIAGDTTNIFTTANNASILTISQGPALILPATNAGLTQGVISVGGSVIASFAGTDNVYLGTSTGNGVGSSFNVGVGTACLSAIATGLRNIGIGLSSLSALDDGTGNVALGYNTGTSLNTNSANYNVALGYDALSSLATGSANVAIGLDAGGALTGAETSNIYILNNGVTGESNTIRIGTQGNTQGQQDACWIAGIYGVTPGGGGTQTVVMDSTGQLGTTAGGGGITTIAGNSGTATGSTVTLHATGAATGGANTFSATGSTVTLNIGDSNFNVALGGGSESFNTVTGSDNVAVGKNTLFQVSSGSRNIAVGRTLGSLTTGSDNIAIGRLALSSVTTTGTNIGIGTSALEAASGGSNNIALGYNAANLLGSGSNNVLIGVSVGSAYFSNESSNIIIGNIGVAHESNVIRIGTQGSGAGQQNACWIAGVYGVTPGGGGTQTVVMDSTGQLGTTSGGGSITINGDTGSATGSTITFTADPSAGSSVSFSATGSTVTLNASDASDNTLVGFHSGNGSLSGSTNTGFGYATLQALTSGDNNTALGAGCLNSATTATDNTAAGQDSLGLVTTGSENTSMGTGSLSALLTGARNVAIGWEAGLAYTSSESSNILIGNAGTVSESNVIHIGTQGSGSGQQNACFIAGIAGVTVASSAAVLINTGTGQLGTIASSRRYKENINDMDAASNNIMNLRPVTFFMKNDPTKQRQYGLIAEEVNEIFPDLVLYNKAGDPESVKYHELPALLLNELQKQHNVIAELQRKIEVLENRRRYEST